MLSYSGLLKEGVELLKEGVRLSKEGVGLLKEEVGLLKEGVGLTLGMTDPLVIPWLYILAFSLFCREDNQSSFIYTT